MLHDIAYFTNERFTVSPNVSPGDKHHDIMPLFSDSQPKSEADHGDPEKGQKQLLLRL